MNKVVSAIWFIIKPANKFHIYIYLFILVLSGYNQLTLPPAKEQGDYKRAIGKFIKVHHWRGDRVFWLKLNNDEIIKLRVTPRENAKVYGYLLNKKVVAYYWPGSLIATKKILIFMAPIDKEKKHLENLINKKDVFFRPDVYGQNNLLICLVFFMTWLVPFMIKVNRNLNSSLTKNVVK